VGFFRRKKKHYSAPPPSDELKSEVADAASTAEIQLTEARALEKEVDDRHAKVEKIKRDNALGPRFWAAVGERRT
jgi:hypothetical protein